MTVPLAIVSGSVGVLAGAGGIVLAAIEPTTQTAIIQVISLAITSVTGIVMAWIAFKQNALNKKTDALAVKQDGFEKKQDGLVEVVADVKKQTDGITSKIVEVTAKASHAEGELKGKADAQLRQDAIDLGSITRAPAKPAEPETLKKIETNTAETAANTAKTDATVQELKAQEPEHKKE